jgi:exodeoxyribonuclease VII small subunit
VTNRGRSAGLPEPDPEERDLPLSSMSFEELVDTLDGLARRISSGEVGIEEAARLYELAGAVHEEASLRLEGVRAKVEGLIGSSGPAPTAPHERDQVDPGPPA